MKSIRGVYLVEFTIVSSALMILIFGCVEFGRATYTLATLNEGTRRAARLAAVCSINNAAIKPAVNFMGAYGFDDTNNVNLAYLDANGAPLTGVPAISAVYYVQVSVTGYSIPLSIPIVNLTVASPPFTVTLPAESLGLDNTGAGMACT